MHVLVVEDDPDTLASLATLLRSRGWLVAPEPGADGALARLRREAFDGVVCDHRLPVSSGAELLALAARLQPTAKRVLYTACSTCPAGPYVVVLKPAVRGLLAALGPCDDRG